MAPIIHNHIESIEDVPKDGNCGFHVVAKQLGPFDLEDRHKGDVCMYIREKMCETLERNRSFYYTMLRGGDKGDEGVKEEYENMRKRLLGSDVLTRDYWMKFPICGFLIAQTFYCVVHNFSVAFSETYAPPGVPCDEVLRGRRVFIAFVEKNHFIGLKLKLGCPIPPLSYSAYWPGYDPNYSGDWCEDYSGEMAMWKAQTIKVAREGRINLCDYEDFEDMQDMQEALQIMDDEVQIIEEVPDLNVAIEEDKDWIPDLNVGLEEMDVGSQWCCRDGQ